MTPAQPLPLLPAAAQHPISTSRATEALGALTHSLHLHTAQLLARETKPSHREKKAWNDFHYQLTEAVAASRWKPHTDVAMTNTSLGLTKQLLG